MRGGVAAAGAVMLILSFFGWMFFFFNPLLGAVMCLLSPLLFIVGLVLLIVGLVLEPAEPTYIYVQQSIPAPAPIANTCPVCRRSMTFYPQKGRWYCHYCRRYR